MSLDRFITCDCSIRLPRFRPNVEIWYVSLYLPMYAYHWTEEELDVEGVAMHVLGDLTSHQIAIDSDR